MLTRAFGGGEAERRISEAHRAVIEGLLGVHTFNAQLAALREINMMLESARGDASGLGAAESAAAAAAATSWIARERVVARALRPTYLHHKQYVDQLCVLLRHLSQERALEDAHVDALWDVAFRPDAFEETRKNVSALLTEVAKDFNAEQLDALFRRVERVFGASRAGSSSSLEDPACVSVSSSHDELLEMVQRLAKGDLTGAMAERTLLLLWRAAADGSARGFAEGPEATRSEKKPRTSDAPRRAHRRAARRREPPRRSRACWSTTTAPGSRPRPSRRGRAGRSRRSPTRTNRRRSRRRRLCSAPSSPRTRARAAAPTTSRPRAMRTRENVVRGRRASRNDARRWSARRAR